MNLNQRYRIHTEKRTIKRYLKLLGIIAFLLIFSYTFASYSSTFIAQSNFKVAQWKIVLNGTLIEENVNVLNNVIELRTTPESSDGLIRAGQTGYFDMEIDPDETEVAIEYQVTIDFSEMPEEIEINSYEKLQNGQVIEQGQIPENNKFSGEINLRTENNIKYRLDSRDTVTYRFYWTWDGEDYVIDYNDNYKVKSTIVVQQKIET